LVCMDMALEQPGACDELVDMLKVPLFRFADALLNKEGPSAATTDSNVIAAG
jgi:hemoglobin